MNWAKIVESSEIKSNTEKKESIEKKVDNINSSEIENKLIEYTPEDIFEFWYATDLIDVLNDIESYTYNSSFNILNNRKFKISYDFINLFKNNIDLSSTPEYIDWINKYDDLSDDEIISDDNLY